MSKLSIYREPCNAASRDDLSKLGPPEVKAPPHNITEVIPNPEKEKLSTNSTSLKDVKEEFLHEIPEIAESPTNYDYKEETGLDEPLKGDDKINMFQIKYEGVCLIIISWQNVFPSEDVS